MSDRESQRAGRERTKNYILHLEKLVESLQQSHGDERVKTLLQQGQELREQNERLVTIISSINRLSRCMELPGAMKNNLNDSTSFPLGPISATAVESTAEQQPTLDTGLVLDRGLSVPLLGKQSLWPPPSLSVEEEQNQTPIRTVSRTGSKSPILYSSSQTTTSSASHLQGQKQITGNSQEVDMPGAFQTCAITSGSRSEVVNNLLTEAKLFTILSTGPEQDADIAIRAVVNGWHTVGSMQTLDPGWNALRQIDQEVFSCCGLVDRLAILLVMRLNLRVSNFPKKLIGGTNSIRKALS
jgi:hypothetical protein